MGLSQKILTLVRVFNKLAIDQAVNCRVKKLFNPIFI